MSTHLCRTHWPTPPSWHTHTHTHTHTPQTPYTHSHTLFPLSGCQNIRVLSLGPNWAQTTWIFSSFHLRFGRQQEVRARAFASTHTREGKWHKYINWQTRSHIHRRDFFHPPFQNWHCLCFAEFRSFVSFLSFASVWTDYIWELLIKSQGKPLAQFSWYVQIL